VSDAVAEAPVPLWRDLVVLSKPGITLMCVIMAAGGMALAWQTDAAGASGLTLIRVAQGLSGVALSVMGANTFNMVWEREGDRSMVRTRQRPLPAGRMSVWTALVWGALCASISLALLYVAQGTLSFCLGLFAILSYVLVYTPAKRRTSQALAIGAVPGAIPPLLGWALATGRMDPPGVVLFLILLLWQLPHFLAISIYRHRDYAAAGIRTVAVVRGEEVAKMQSLIYTVFMFPVSLLLVPMGTAGFLYFAVAGALGAWFFVLSVQGFEPGAGTVWARRFFLASLIYLPALCVALLVDVALRAGFG
jgi:protoheme IX farnesyltransferase